MDTGAPGRKRHNFYSKLYFVNKKLANGRTAAQCTVCNVVLKNTAIARLRTHKKRCHSADPSESGSEDEPEESAFGCNVAMLGKRKLSTTIKQEQLLTGGGPPMKVPDDPVVEFVDAAAPNLDVELSCPWGSTAVNEVENNISTKRMKTDPSEFETTSTSTTTAASVQTGTPSAKTRKTLEGFHERAAEIKESVLQQRELHKIRMKTANMEYLLAALKVRQQLQQMGSVLDLDDIDMNSFDPKQCLLNM